MQFFLGHFKTEEEVELLMKAVQNYSKSKQVEDGYAKDCIRFLKKDFWKDWIEEPVKQDDIYSHLEIARADK